MKIFALLLVAGLVGLAMHFHEVADGLTARFSGSNAQAAKANWLENEEQALLDAKSTNKFVLLRFTGSDWCGVCQALDREVLSKSEFKEMADKNFVLVEIDFPRRKSQPANLVEQNARLAQQYQVRGLPAIIVLDSNGVAVQRLGYRPGAPAKFLEELKAFERVDSHS